MVTSWVNFKSLLLFSAALLISGCSYSVQMAEVDGTIETSEGVPVEEGMLLFTPILDGKQDPAPRGAVGRIKQGKFLLSTDGKHDGIATGRHRVRLTEASFAEDSGLEAVLPETLEVEIQNGKNNLKLVVDAVPKSQSLDPDDDDDD